MTCCLCSGPIDPERAEFLEMTGRRSVCKACSGEAPQLVLMEYGHKTAGFAVAVPNNPEAQRLALRAYRRAR